MKALRERLQAAGQALRQRPMPPTGDAGLVSLPLTLGDYDGDWLTHLPAPAHPFCYQGRADEREYHLGLGVAWEAEAAGPERFAKLAAALAAARPAGAPLAFLGFAFSPDASPALGNARLRLPTLLLSARAGQAEACFCAPRDRLEHDWSAMLDALDRPAPPSPPVRLTAADEPGARVRWQARVDAALRAIAAGDFEKVVLTRERTVRADRDFSPGRILGHLLAGHTGSLVHAWQQAGACFLGATPERLIALQDGNLDCDALAGTAWQDSPALELDKNCREQQYVVAALRAWLEPHCEPGSLRVGPRTRRQAGPLSHWQSRLQARGRPGTSLLGLAAALHPTPAVGGHPRGPALDWLAAAGEVRQAWYSGGIGRIDARGNGEICVALRSAWLQGRQAHLQAGAGIVAASDAALEFAETGAKLDSVLAALRA